MPAAAPRMILSALTLLASGPVEVQLMRARLPDESGYVVNSGVRIHYEVHGTGQPTILLLPTWAIVDSRHWKMQVPFLARDYRVITFDPRGNGRSDRPRNPAAYADAVFASDAAAVLDATGTERAVLAAFCSGFPWALLFAAAHPQRVTGIVTIAPTLPIPPAAPWERDGHSFDDVLDTTDGWAKENRHYWRRDWRGYVEFFMSQITTEPHSTKPYDDLVEWGMQTDAETLLCDADAPQQVADEQEAIRLCRSLACPVLVIGGDQDKIVPPERVRRIAELTGAELLVIEGGGHAPHVRYPVAVNHAIRDFVDRVVHRQRKQAVWQATHGRPRRALWVSSPIGLGHVQRDLAIARALRERRARPGDPLVGAAAGDRGTRRRRGDHSPGELRSGLRVGALGVGIRAARPARVLRVPPDGRDPVRELPAVRQRGQGHQLRPMGG